MSVCLWVCGSVHGHSNAMGRAVCSDVADPSYLTYHPSSPLRLNQATANRSLLLAADWLTCCYCCCCCMLYWLALGITCRLRSVMSTTIWSGRWTFHIAYQPSLKHNFHYAEKLRLQTMQHVVQQVHKNKVAEFGSYSLVYFSPVANRLGVTLKIWLVRDAFY